METAAEALLHHGSGGDGLALAVQAEDAVPLDEAALGHISHTGLGVENLFAVAADEHVHAGALIVFHRSSEDIGDGIVQGHGKASF